MQVHWTRWLISTLISFWFSLDFLISGGGQRWTMDRCINMLIFIDQLAAGVSDGYQWRVPVPLVPYPTHKRQETKNKRKAHSAMSWSQLAAVDNIPRPTFSDASNHGYYASSAMLMRRHIIGLCKWAREPTMEQSSFPMPSTYVLAPMPITFSL